MMRNGIEYGRAERWALGLVAVAGLVGLNGAFVYGLMQPELVRATLDNPLALAFVVEALVLLPVLAYLLAKWEVARLGWRWFVGLSLLGSMAFALPVVLLWPRRGGEGRRATGQREDPAEPHIATP